MSIGLIKRALELSKLDQENLRLKIKEWEANDLESTFFFRPYITAEAEPEHPPSGQLPKKEEMKNMKEFQGNSGGDDDWCEVLGSHEQCSQTFIYVHQTQWQKKLLEHYGNNISLIDATYKTTRYDLALFSFVLEQTWGTVWLVSSSPRLKLLNTSLKHCNSYVAGILCGTHNFSGQIIRRLNFWLLNRPFLVYKYTCVIFTANKRGSGGQTITNMVSVMMRKNLFYPC